MTATSSRPPERCRHERPYSVCWAVPALPRENPTGVGKAWWYGYPEVFVYFEVNKGVPESQHRYTWNVQYGFQRATSPWTTMNPNAFVAWPRTGTRRPRVPRPRRGRFFFPGIQPGRRRRGEARAHAHGLRRPIEPRSTTPCSGNLAVRLFLCCGYAGSHLPRRQPTTERGRGRGRDAPKWGAEMLPTTRRDCG